MEKLAAAQRLLDEIGIARPNMAWVLGRGGTILYKAMWTSAAHVGRFLEARPAGRPASTFYAEELAPVARDRESFERGLERNGPRAVTEFDRAEARWAERARASSS